MKKSKRSLSIVLTIIMLLSLMPFSTITASAGIISDQYFSVNGKSVCRTTVSHKGNCWSYANEMYTYIWGSGFDSSFTTNNMLRNLSDNERLVTAANTKKFVESAAIGATIRITNAESSSYAFAGDGTAYTDGTYGHNVILVGRDANGLYCLEDWSSKSVTAYYTWAEFGVLYNSYKYFKYIKWPGAAAYTGVSTTPTGAWIWSDKTIAAVGEEVAFNFNATGAGWYVIGIYHNNELSVVDNGTSDWYRTSFSSPGTYIVHAAIYNNVGHTDTSNIIINVYDSAPPAPEVNVSKTNLAVDEQSNISWAPCSNALMYIVSIWKSDVHVLRTETSSCSYNFSLSEPGTYVVIVYAVNNCGETSSQWITVTVGTKTVSFNPNGGTGAPDAQTKTEGESLTLSSVKPARYGYSFLGWSTDENASLPEYLAGGEFTADANTTLYAVWGVCDHSCGKTLTGYSDTHPHYAIYKCNNCDYTSFGTETQKNLSCDECIFSVSSLDNGKCKIIGYTGEGGEIVIPSVIGSAGVYSTNTGALKNNTEITSVTIKEGVTEIGGLTFMGCANLKKAVIPASVTTIGAYAFYDCSESLVIYCFKNSAAYTYAVENSLNYVVMDIKPTEKTVIDYDNKIVFTSVYNSKTLNSLLLPTDNVMLFPVASRTVGNDDFYGTGSSVSVFENNKLVSDYTVIVKGDLNGDSVCDVLDIMMTEQYSSSHGAASQNQTYAANGCISENVDINSYQSVVNTALAG